MRDYDKELLEIEFYKLHPEYLPFVGGRFDEYRILHIGESHYIGQEKSLSVHDKYPVTYFHQWWDSACDDLNGEYGGWYNTRQVIANYLSGARHRSHSIFSEMVKVFDKVCLGRDNVSMNYQESQNYHYFAFMNFYQMPALYKGEKFWNSLLFSAFKLGDKQLAYEMYEKAALVSSEVLDDVIDILGPRAVVFTSESARDAYDKYGRYKEEPFIIRSTHPGCSWWNRPLRRYDGRTGKQETERAFTEIFNS